MGLKRVSGRITKTNVNALLMLTRWMNDTFMLFPLPVGFIA
jgi:hypothetical protein